MPPVPLRVLVVDDNRDAAATLAGLLILSGHHARYFLDAQTALAAVAEFRPDVCLLDLRMPGMDGCTLAERLRADLGDDVPLVAITGEHGAEAQVRARASGFDMWFSKPADPQAVLDYLGRLTPSRRAVRPAVAALDGLPGA